MVVVDVLVGGSLTLGNDALDDLVVLELLGLALALEVNSLEVLAAEARVLHEVDLGPVHVLDVVLDALEPLEAAQVLVRLPRVVDVAVALPLDEKAHVALGVVFGLVDCRRGVRTSR